MKPSDKHWPPLDVAPLAIKRSDGVDRVVRRGRFQLGSFAVKKPGGTRKIAEPPMVCQHPQHNPPTMRVFSPGVYEHVCPGCGATMAFTVDRPTL